MLVTVTLDDKKLFKLLKGAEEAVPLYSCDEQLKKVNETIDKLDNDCDDVLNDEFLDSIVDTLLNFDLLDYKEELYRVPHPGIIFRFSSNNHTEVYSVKEEKLEDLNANTKLYLWAYGHGYGNGSICTGSVQLHLENFHMAGKLADKFLNAANSHANSNVDIKETLDYFKNHNTKKYPKKFLKELNVSKTLGDILV